MIKKLFNDQTTILLVEDDILIRQDTAQNLSDEGYTVLEASSAKEAMAHVEQAPSISILLSDIDISGPVDGFELAKSVREVHKKIRVILISGAVLPAQDDDTDFLQKPYRMDELLEVIQGR